MVGRPSPGSGWRDVSRFSAACEQSSSGMALAHRLPGCRKRRPSLDPHAHALTNDQCKHVGALPAARIQGRPRPQIPDRSLNQGHAPRLFSSKESGQRFALMRPDELHGDGGTLQLKRRKPRNVILMDNRKRLVSALCSVALGASLCAFAGRAPGKTLFVGLTPPVPPTPLLRAPWSECNGLNLIIATAQGYDSGGSLVCTATDYYGDTVSTSCPNSAAYLVTGVTEMSVTTGADRRLCTAYAGWGVPGPVCYATVNAHAPGRAGCTSTQFRSMAASQ